MTAARTRVLVMLVVAAGTSLTIGPWGPAGVRAATSPLREYAVPIGSHPHDVAPARDGTVWYSAQTAGELGRLDPATGKIQRVKLGEGSAPHGVIIGPDGAAWATDGGLNAIVRVTADGTSVKRFPLPPGQTRNDLNTAVFDKHGVLWFTGQGGIYGKLTVETGRVEIWEAPRGRGPYGIAVTPAGGIYFASLAGSYVGRIDPPTGKVTVLEPPTPRSGTRRIWSDSHGRLWISEWDGGRLARYDPAANAWKEYPLPGQSPKPYAVYVDDHDSVWLSDWDANALVRFDPRTETFESFPLPSASGGVRQLNGRPGQVWGAESSVNKLVVWQAR